MTISSKIWAAFVLMWLPAITKGNSCLVDHFHRDKAAIAATCRTVDLHGLELGPEGLAGLSVGIQAATKAAKYEIGGNNLGDEGVQSLATSLTVNRVLSKLCLRKNSIGSLGARAVGRLLSYSQTIRDLDLFGNNLRDEGAMAIASAVMQHSSLINLDLRGNSIGTAGIQVLGDAVAKNSVLRRLNLAGNNFSDPGALVMAQMLLHNKALVELDLSGTGISEEGAQALLQALDHHPTLSVLNLMWNDIEIDTLDQIFAKLDPQHAMNFVADEDSLNMNDTEPTDFADNVESDDLELHALHHKELAFKRTMEKESKSADTSTPGSPSIPLSDLKAAYKNRSPEQERVKQRLLGLMGKQGRTPRDTIKIAVPEEWLEEGEGTSGHAEGVQWNR